METTYQPTSDPDVVERVDSDDIDMGSLVNQYLELKQTFLALPDNQKTVPDQETLDFWNAEQGALHNLLISPIVSAAIRLKADIDPVRDAGLFPIQYEDEYTQLVNFINTYS